MSGPILYKAFINKTLNEAYAVAEIDMFLTNTSASLKSLIPVKYIKEFEETREFMIFKP